MVYRFVLENKENREYTDFIGGKEWVGYAEESVFEVNMLVINTELVFCSNYNKGVFDYLKKIGIPYEFSNKIRG